MDLTEAIEAELSWVLQGGARGDALVGEVRHAVIAVLGRYGRRPAHLHVSVHAGVVQVDLRLPDDPARVREIRVRWAP